MCIKDHDFMEKLTFFRQIKAFAEGVSTSSKRQLKKQPQKANRNSNEFCKLVQ